MNGSPQRALAHGHHQ